MMNPKARTVVKRIAVIALAVCLAVVAGNYSMNIVFYNPYRDSSTTSPTFAILNQLLSPSVTESHLDVNVQGNFLNFSHHSQAFRLLKFSYVRSPYEPYNKGELNYRFGRAKLENYADRLNLGDLTCLQSVFLSSPGTPNNWETITDNQSYEVWIKFDAPINRVAFVEKYGWLLDNSISRPKKSGISWIPVQTSEKAEDVCLGLAGNLSFHYLANNVFGVQDFYDMDLYGRELVFDEALKFLTEHPKDTNIFINTNLWPGGETVNFKERYDYIQKNGIQYLGFVAYIKGTDLRALENDAVSIVRLSEDK